MDKDKERSPYLEYDEEGNVILNDDSISVDTMKEGYEKEKPKKDQS